MRGKRSKQYRKLMQQYGLSFGFREPYQVLLDADIIKDADRFKMDLVGGLERTLHGKVKPMITQCCMRHLYTASKEPGMSFIIDKAKLFERRRCDHRPEEYPEPLSATKCLSTVVDPKDSKTNKHRYVVASQQLEVRKAMREVMGVPLVYINRSVMIMEPMAGATVQNRDREEKGKFRAGIKSGRASGRQGMKRKREEADHETQQGLSGPSDGGDNSAKRKKVYGQGPKGPNPLSVKKPKRGNELDRDSAATKKLSGQVDEASSEAIIKRKRRRKHKAGTGVGNIAPTREVDPGAVED